jgi:hypothetical protein
MFSFDILTDPLFAVPPDVLAGFSEERLASSSSYELTDGMGRLSGGRPAMTAAGSMSRRWVRLTTRCTFSST